VEPDRICQIVDTVIDLSAPSKTALLQDLARRAAPVVNVDANFFSMLCYSARSWDRLGLATAWRFRTCGWSR
jgi:hypothetical protein